MARAYFLDSSAILKRYLSERGSRYVLALPQTAEDILYIAQIAGVEVISAIARKALGKEIRKHSAQVSLVQFRRDFTSKYVVLSSTDQLIERAMQLAETHALRAYDAIQLATAMTIAQSGAGLYIIFVCADEQLNNVARAEGFTVDNPNDQV